MAEYAQHGTGYQVLEGEEPEILSRNLVAAGQLLAGATAFFFLTFLFAYFYLRSLNNGGQWRPKHTDPSIAYGTIITVLILVAAIVVRAGLADQRAFRRQQWRLKGGAALALGLVALVLQIVQWETMNFGPASGGYASVFYGWTGAQMLFLFGAIYWLETLLATAIRYRNVPHDSPPPGHASGDPHRHAHDIAEPLSLVRPGLEAATFYWAFLAGSAIVVWIVLYLV